MKKSILISAAVIACCMLSAVCCFSQGAAINNSGTPADSSAILDVGSTSQGILIPRLTEAQKNIIPNPATSLMIFQSDGALPGYYYNAGTPGAKNWVYLGNDNLGNHTASDSLNMSNNKIVNLATCTNNYDAANKLYVDNTVAAGGGGGHYLGESYQGGKVFWIDGTGQHGLIAFPVDNDSGKAWSNLQVEIGKNAKHMDDGMINSSEIVNQPGHTGSAAKTCIDLSIVDGGITYDDWYLPALNELDELFINQMYVGSFHGGSNRYWSSTESSTTSAFFIYFELPKRVLTNYSTTTKTNNYDYYSVRCIRKF